MQGSYGAGSFWLNRKRYSNQVRTRLLAYATGRQIPKTCTRPLAHEDRQMKIEAVGLTRLQLVILLTAMTAIGGIATNIYIPTLPDLTRDLGTTKAMAQNTLSAYFAGVAFAQLIYGPLSDKYGRRPVLLFGLLLFVFATIMCALSPTIDTLIWARFAQAAGACVGQVIMRAVVRDLFNRNETASMMASITLAIALAPAAAPILGALIHMAFDWRWNFGFVAVFGVVILFLARRFLPETLKPEHRTTSGAGAMLGGYQRLLLSPGFMGYSLCSMFIFALLFSFQSQVPFLIIDELGFTELEFALIGMVPIVGFVAGSYSAGRFTPHVGIDRMITLGMFITVGGAALLLVLSQALPLSALAIMVPMAFIVLGMGMVFPNASAAAVSIYPEIAGTASAALGFMQMAGGGLAVTLVAAIPGDSYQNLTAAMFVFAVLAALSPLAHHLSSPPAN
jgi:MFS transporter, DHA1 family, multidrug resistance protein